MAQSVAAVEMSEIESEVLQRGAEMKRKLLGEEGGVLSAQAFSEKLGITLLELGRMRKRNEVFWLDVGNDYAYPSFQLGENGLLPGIRETLDSFAFDHPWTRVNFMLSGDLRLGGWRPIEALREGRVEEVKLAARAYGEHGAA